MQTITYIFQLNANSINITRETTITSTKNMIDSRRHGIQSFTHTRSSSTSHNLDQNLFAKRIHKEKSLCWTIDKEVSLDSHHFRLFCSVCFLSFFVFVAVVENLFACLNIRERVMIFSLFIWILSPQCLSQFSIRKSAANNYGGPMIYFYLWM